MVGKHIRRDALKYYKMGKIPLGRPYWVRGDFRVKTVVPPTFHDALVQKQNVNMKKMYVIFHQGNKPNIPWFLLDSLQITVLNRIR